MESFYIVNGIAVTATKDVMEKAASFPEVEKVLPNQKIKLGNTEKPTVESKTSADRSPLPTFSRFMRLMSGKSAIKAKEPLSLRLTPALSGIIRR